MIWEWGTTTWDQEAWLSRFAICVLRKLRNHSGPSQPTKRFTTHELAGALAVFLCSEAASTMTDSELVMGGGWTVQ